MDTQLTILASFGGPRHLDEVLAFLQELLTDRAVIRTPLSPWLHRLLFRAVARWRARKTRRDYVLIGGASPIFADAEQLAVMLKEILTGEVIAFHRYLPETHPSFLRTVQALKPSSITVFPLFPQWSSATSGSVARYLQEHLDCDILFWTTSYAAHPAYVHAMQRTIARFLAQSHLKEEETLLLFSPHGLPASFITSGDPYERECQRSLQEIAAAFPKAATLLAYQSKFGWGKWLAPSTLSVCKQILRWHQGRRHIVVVPLSFVSDHIETLFEIEHLYLPLIRATGLAAWRCPALNTSPEWVQAIATILKTNT